MSVEGWKYYNHAMIPDCAPHEEADISPVRSGEIWQNCRGGGYPLFARWTTDWDCGCETNWWYIVRSGRYDIDQLSKSARKHIRQAQKKCIVREINDEEVQELYNCYKAAYKRYSNADNFSDFESIKNAFINRNHDSRKYYGAYEIDTNHLVGFFICTIYTDYIEINTSKFDAEYMNLRPSDALHHYVLEQWLNNPKIKYICSGSRSINHETNVQEYKITTFGFRKAYCKLHIEYNPRIKWAIPLLYPMRKTLLKFDGIGLIHQINAVLKMEEIVRSE